MFKRFMFAAVASVAAFSPVVARAAWEAPKDGRVTEKQVVAYTQAMKEWVDVLKASGKAVEGKSGAAAIGIAAAADGGFKAALAKAGLTQEEFNWVGEKVWEARSALMVAEMYTKGKADITEQLKQNDQQQAEAKAKIAKYEAALKAGRRVLDDEQKKQAVADAKEDEKTYLAEAKDLEAQAKEIVGQIAEAEKEAKAADALATKPPADVPADERADYVKEKQEEAKAARERIKEHKEQQAEAQKAVAEAKAKATAAAARVKDPEVVAATDAAEVRERNQSYLESAQGELKRLAEARPFMAQMAAGFDQQWAESLAKANKQNVELVQKHLPAIDAILNGK